MATYIMLSRLSTQGIKSVRRKPQRIKEVNKEIEALGARVINQYAVFGAYDFVTVLEAPDAETVARVSVELGTRGSANYETLAAVPVDEFISSISSLTE